MLPSLRPPFRVRAHSRPLRYVFIAVWLWQNWLNEVAWLVGVVVRTVFSRIVSGIVTVMIFDLALQTRSLDWSFRAAACYLTIEFLEHVRTWSSEPWSYILLNDWRSVLFCGSSHRIGTTLRG